MPRRGTEKRAMTEQALVRLSGPLAIAVSAAAAADGLSVPAWLRGLAVVALEGDPDRHARPTSPGYVPTRDLEELGVLQRLVSRMNGAVVQFTADFRKAGETDLHAEAESVLAALRAVCDELEKLVEQEKRHARGRN